MSLRSRDRDPPGAFVFASPSVILILLFSKANLAYTFSEELLAETQRNTCDGSCFQAETHKENRTYNFRFKIVCNRSEEMSGGVAPSCDLSGDKGWLDV